MLDKAVKDDKDKLDLTLIPWESLQSVAKVFRYGAQKYEVDNWRLLEPDRLKKAFLRHMLEWLCGYEKDSESELTHLSHMTANLLMLQYFDCQKDKGKKR